MSYDVVKRRQGRGASLHAAAIAACAVVLSFSGAYDTDELTLAHRLLLFTIIAGLLIAQASLFDSIFRRLVRGEGAIALIRAAMTIGLTLLAMTLEVHALKFTPLLPKAEDPLLDFYVFLAPIVMPVALLVLLLKRGFAGRVVLAPPEDGAPGLLVSPGLSDLQTGWKAPDVLFVRAEDHYLEIRTIGSRYYVRGRMSDALQLLNGQAGEQVHRSWWVADRAVAQARRHARDVKLDLTSGETVPVSRSRIEAVRARGWLARQPLTTSCME